MAGRPKRRARIAAQWAEVDRAAGRTSNAGRPKRRARIAAQWAEVDRAAGVKMPHRKRNGERYRLFESRGNRLNGRDLMLVDTIAHEGYYQILWLGVDDSGRDDVNHTEVRAFDCDFDPADYTFGRELPLDKVPVRFRKYVSEHTGAARSRKRNPKPDLRGLSDALARANDAYEDAFLRVILGKANQHAHSNTREAIKLRHELDKARTALNIAEHAYVTARAESLR
jgi:hypothetical protein